MDSLSNSCKDKKRWTLSQTKKKSLGYVCKTTSCRVRVPTFGKTNGTKKEIEFVLIATLIMIKSSKEGIQPKLGVHLMLWHWIWSVVSNLFNFKSLFINFAMWIHVKRVLHVFLPPYSLFYLSFECVYRRVETLFIALF